ncbi:MAG: N-acetylglucosamine-6-phosphate deacetylase [Chlamydiae bacterium]|nr:N-acetylglucosamine-6-phosphate deacetylase [Chlamydiota bacterium]MBI3277426.1 N-acetylglucosamine-6-phosphate deacetylase [Chlamydiota bacterium]
MQSRPVAIVGGKILQGDQFVFGDLLVKNGKIEEISPKISSRKATSVDASGLRVIPGFIDLHLHCDLPGKSKDPRQYVEDISSSHARFGTTRFLATFCTAPLQKLKSYGDLIKSVKGRLKGAEILGCHLEGPFLNCKQAGAQPIAYIRKPSLALLKEVIHAFKNNLSLMTLAPELKGIGEVIAYLKDHHILPSMGHTNATYEEASCGIELGIQYGTHVFNQMPRLHHRELGAVGAILSNSRVFAEVIADGIHVHPLMVKWLLQIKGLEKLVLATDCFTPLSNDINQPPPRLETGTLAGSALSLRRAILNLIQFANVGEASAINAASLNPAKVLGINQEYGSLEPGKFADIVLVDEAFNVKMTMVAGRIVYSN